METDNKDLYKYGSNKIKELSIDLWNKINDILFDITFKEKFYLLENSLFELPKCECGNSVKFIDMINGYREFCSRRCMYDSRKLKEKRKETCIEKWGVDNPSKSNQVKKKVIKTNIDKFGHEWATKSDDIKNKIKDKFIENWGVDNPSKVKKVRDKAKETMLERFGVEHAMHSDDIKNKIKDRFIENWGVDNPSKVKEVRDKAKETMLERFGVEYPLQNIEIFNKSKSTLFNNWGVTSPLLNKEISDKLKFNNIKKWGFENPSKSDVIKDKIKDSIIKKYNTLNLLEVKEIKDKIDKTNNDRWSESHISRNDDYRKKYKISKHKNYLNYIKDGISLFSCDKGEDHTFEIYIDNYIKRHESNNPICTVCNPIGDLKSIKEKELYLYIKNIYNGDIIQSYRDGLEIDVYLPDLKLGFEFNGLYWHSELKKDKNYHLHKTNFFGEKGVRIIHIWEDDWTFNRDVIKSQINNWLGISENKIWARKCEVRLVNNKLSKSFLNRNHIQGHVNSNLSIGLYNNNELVSLMTFDNYEGRKKMEEGGWNLSRFCNRLNTNVVGGASKLLKYFIKNYSPNRIISYADKSWSSGELYHTLGFNKVSDSNPDYKYIVNEKRVHKSRYKKSNLKNSNISESEYTKIKNIIKIWDCGKLKFTIENLSEKKRDN
jgi:hypothetical protein